MRNVQVMAVGTLCQILRLEREMTAAAVSPTFGKFSFWKRWHFVLLVTGWSDSIRPTNLVVLRNAGQFPRSDVRTPYRYDFCRK